jgi:steroid delta-isomerase-like uncharacterized protein
MNLPKAIIPLPSRQKKMSSIQTVSAYYAAFNRGDLEAMLDLAHDDIRHEPNQGTPRIGKALFAEFLQKMDSAYSEQIHDLVLFEGQVPGRVAAEFTIHGIYKQGEAGLPEAHGQSYILPVGAFLEVRDGKVARVTTYYNLELWIELVS